MIVNEKRLCLLLSVVALLALATSGCDCGQSPVADAGPDARALPDGAPRDGGAMTPDAGNFAGLGRRCTTDAECPSGYCVDAVVGRLCSAPCDTDCPTGWACRATEVADEFVSLCLPVVPRLCAPCSNDSECPGGACIPDPDGGEGYCAAICFEGSCPTGYACGPHPTMPTGSEYCLPETGSCTCTIANDGAIRTCQVTNAIGTCFGTETCHASEGGWVGCDANTPADEVCDGQDNDCDFQIDDGVDGTACVNDIPGVGSCPGVLLCLGAAGLDCQGRTPAPEICNYTDDNCDGRVDEGFANLGMVCNDGVGACFRNGVIRCTADGSATECSAMRGSALPESCNGIDDNCDGSIDETYPTLGQACTVGISLCERQGTLICPAGGGDPVCSATPGTGSPEICNSLDDDCDGPIDETFRDSTGAYNTNSACGGCGVDCTRIFGLPNAFGTCDTSSGPRCVMNCSAMAFDLNAVVADGCEFLLDPGAIYVSIADPAAADDSTCGLGPVGTGPGYHPCESITFGLSRAVATTRSRVLVANGVYDEAVTLVNGKFLQGGYRPDTWERDVTATSTQIHGVASLGNHDYTVRANNITTDTLFQGFIVRGSVNGKVGGNSYAIYVTASPMLRIRANIIFGGRGGPGQSGGPGGAGALGIDGVGRDSSGVNAATYDAFVTTGTGNCNTSNNRQHLNGAVMMCGTTNVSGGNGGGNRCPVSATFTQYSAISGFVGQTTGGTGGPGGYDMRWGTQGGSVLCFIPTKPNGDPQPTYGADGANGRLGTNGAAGGACTMANGSVSAGHWVGGSGMTGGLGTPGAGGGGGGAGAGGSCTMNQGCNNHDTIGGHGGGAGSGGCGGVGGMPGAGGGASFGIFISSTGTAPNVANNTIVRGEGGVGGGGGSGGAGGLGGTGAAGGTTAVFCADQAGRGGNGGSGGHGAGGGGGCGGGSFGIYTSGIGNPGYCTTNTVSGGAGGTGGSGGYSLGNTGTSGATGALATCISI